MSTVFEAMSAEHAESVMGIFNHYIEHTFAAYPEAPLPARAFGMLAQMADGYPAFAMKDEGGTVVGFCFLHAYRPMSSFRETAEITCFIAPDSVGEGRGSAALSLLEEEGKKAGVRHILAGISSRNEGSVRFFRRHGFRECGRLEMIGRKMGETFDVIHMQKDL